MKKIGGRIKKIRMRKGISQEELAEAAQVNLRTIQRIENNKNEPRGSTLNFICSALNIHAEDLFEYGKETDNKFIMFLHLSVLTFWVFPIGNIIIPLVLWLNNKNRIQYLDEVGKNLLNFQIWWTIFTFALVIFFAIFKINQNPFSEFFFYGWLIFNVANTVIPIVFAIKAKKEIFLHYPVPLRILR